MRSFTKYIEFTDYNSNLKWIKYDEFLNYQKK